MRALTYNIHLATAGGLSGVESVLRGQQPDLVALQEVAGRHVAEALAGALGMRAVFGEANDGEHHLAWLSRLPVRRSRNRPVPELATTLLEVDVAWDDVTLRAFAVHLASRHHRSTPEQEIAAILELVRPGPDQLSLLAGDLNALRPGDPTGEPPAGVRRRGDAVEGAPRRAVALFLESGYVDCYRALHPSAPGYTYPADGPWLRLDAIFASPHLAGRLRECRVLSGSRAERASDHFPVRALFV